MDCLSGVPSEPVGPPKSSFAHKNPVGWMGQRIVNRVRSMHQRRCLGRWTIRRTITNYREKAFPRTKCQDSSFFQGMKETSRP